MIGEDDSWLLNDRNRPPIKNVAIAGFSDMLPEKYEANVSE
jgi:hypothetical protein